MPIGWVPPPIPRPETPGTRTGTAAAAGSPARRRATRPGPFRSRSRTWSQFRHSGDAAVGDQGGADGRKALGRRGVGPVRFPGRGDERPVLPYLRSYTLPYV